MTPAPLLAATVLEALPHLVGMPMVMVVLAILWGLCAAVAWAVRRIVPAPVEAAAEPSAPTSVEAAPAGSALAPELVAVIAAAVASTVGKSHRIVSIKSASDEWEKAGRQSVLGSHRIR